jgi:hypothetical protein
MLSRFPQSEGFVDESDRLRQLQGRTIPLILAEVVAGPIPAHFAAAAQPTVDLTLSRAAGVTPHANVEQV